MRYMNIIHKYLRPINQYFLIMDRTENDCFIIRLEETLQVFHKSF